MARDPSQKGKRPPQFPPPSRNRVKSVPIKMHRTITQKAENSKKKEKQNSAKEISQARKEEVPRH